MKYELNLFNVQASFSVLSDGEISLAIHTALMAYITQDFRTLMASFPFLNILYEP